MTSPIFPRQECHGKEMHVLCSNKANFVIQCPTAQNNKRTINECLETFHKDRNINKVRHWKKLNTAMKKMSVTTMGCATVLCHMQNLKNDDNIECFKIISDDRFVLRHGGKDGRRLAKQLPS